MATPELAAALLHDQRAAYAYAQRAGPARVLALLQEAQRDLERRLGASLAGTDSFTDTRLRATLAQVRETLARLTLGMSKTIPAGAATAGQMAAGNVLSYMQQAERKFRGAGAQPLGIDVAEMVDTARSGASASVLRRLLSDPKHPAQGGILSRYGAATVDHFEGVLRKALVARKSVDEVREDLTEKSPFLQAAPRYWAERIARTECLVGETRVTGAVVRAAFRRWYEGPVVEVETEAGRHFTTTPNHPMLTRRGWVGTGDLGKGDYLVGYRGQQNAGSAGDEHVANPPSTIAEIFDSLSAVGVGERRRTAPPDFHGDGANGEVDILRPNRPLRVGTFAALYEPIAKEVFATTNQASARFCARCRRLLSVQEQPCHCWVPTMGASFFDSPRNRTAVGDELHREALRTLSRDVAADDLRIWQVIAAAGMAEDAETILRGSSTISNHTGLSEDSLDRVWPQTHRSGDTFGAKAGDVEFDRVRSVSVREFRGHVYNLHTEHGYFAINGAYTGNTMGAYNRGSHAAIEQAHEELGDMVKILCATFDDRTGADSFAVHGQIRRPSEPFVSWFGPYMHPPNRPSDRETVVPQRLSWPLPKHLAWRPDSDVFARWRMEGRKGRPPPRPLMTTVPLSSFATAKSVRSSGQPESRGDSDRADEKKRR